MSLSETGGVARPVDGERSAAKGWLRALQGSALIANDPTHIFPSAIDAIAEKFGASPALLSDNESLTYTALAQRSNQYARWALDEGLRLGETVCLFMPNRPEYMAIWLGITRIGGIVSLLNTGLVGPSLAHCIDTVTPKIIIVAAEFTEILLAAMPHLAISAKVWAHGAGGHDFPRIDTRLDSYSGESLMQDEQRRPTLADRALYIYTSGTTGLPKAAIITHQRVMLWSHWFAGMMDTRSGDRMYNCLPMYHSVGGVLATGAVLVNGGSVVIKERFSARQFWDDIIRWDCTLFQYIGELCRYLVHSPPHSLETKHRIRLCCGNGLRGDVWEEFKNRFKIPQILEFYAATEGNVSIYNLEGKPGALGRVPAYLVHRFPLAVVKFDLESERPIRDKQGFCIRCSPNEVGEAIGRILGDKSNQGGRFEGYTNQQETERKVLRDVFEPGDAWFRTGDLMRKDENGFFYFVDRIGDTFRWKGENVATSEVSEAISGFAGINDATVYGVTIPGMEGRAGMAALVVNAEFDLTGFRQHLLKRLPSYARPLFLRVGGEIEVTGTFKHKKSELVRQGYDPAVITDKVYFNDPDRQAFVQLDQELFRRIQIGQVRL